MSDRSPWKQTFGLDDLPRINSSWRTTLEVHSKNMTFWQHRSDSVFPTNGFRASSEGEESPFYWPYGYFNNNKYASVIYCEEGVELCDLRSGGCWLGPMTWADPHLFFKSRYRDDSDRPEPTKYDPVFLLLNLALGQSNIGTSWAGLQAASHCRYFDCQDFPEDQWIREIRRIFEASLAKIQFTALDIARGTGNKLEDYEGIRPADRGICSAVKFKSNGWRNVNFWGLLSLLVLICAIFLASLRTEASHELWLTVGMSWIIMTLGTAYQLVLFSGAYILRFLEFGSKQN